MSLSNVVNLPTSQDVEEAKRSSRTLAKYADADRVKLKVESNDGSDEFILPGAVMQLLLDILSEISQGNAISLMPIHTQLTTQEAANILNVSRPHLVSLLEGKEIPFHKVGAHRRIYAQDVIEYKRRIDDARAETLNKLAQLSQEMDMGY